MPEQIKAHPIIFGVVAVLGVFAVLIWAISAGAEGVGIVAMLLILPAIYVAINNRTPAEEAPVSDTPITTEERQRVLDREIQALISRGYIVQSRSQDAAQLVRPKRFSFIWALLWLLMFGIGIVVYLIYYAAAVDHAAGARSLDSVRTTRRVDPPR